MESVKWLSDPIIKKSQLGKLCDWHLTYYNSQAEAFVIMMDVLDSIFARYNLQYVLPLAECSGDTGDNHIFLQWRPIYPYKQSHEDFDLEEKLAYERDYAAELSIKISGLHPEYEGELVFSYRDKTHVLVESTDVFNYTEHKKQRMPPFFVRWVTDISKQILAKNVKS